jgi:hypothetical protein
VYSDEIATDSEANRHPCRAKRHPRNRSEATLGFCT